MSYKDETTEAREARWQRLHLMTDEQNAANIADDQDSQVPIDALRGNKMGWKPIIRADGSKIVPLVLDARTSAFMDAAHIDCQLFIHNMMKAFMASQQHTAD